MGTLARILSGSMLVASLFAAPGQHGFYGVQPGPGLPPNAGMHVPFVGNQQWGSGYRNFNHGRPGGGGAFGWGGGGFHEGFEGGRRHHYPGVFAFPFFPVTNWGAYLDESNPYYEQGAPPPEAYGPNPYAAAPPPQAYYPQQPPPGLMPEPQQPVQQQQEPVQQTPPEPQPPLVLVLQNGQKLELTNYAIVDNVLWDLSKPATHKIPLSTVNIPASEKATEDNGGEFPQVQPSQSR